MPYKQKKSQRKPVIMLSTFVGACDVAPRKDDSNQYLLLKIVTTNIWEGLTRVIKFYMFI